MNLENIRKSGELQLESGNISGAYKTFELGLSRSKVGSYDEMVFLTLLGESALLKQNYETALRHLKNALDSKEGDMNPYILFHIGLTYFESGDFERAKRMFFAVYHIEGKQIFDDYDRKYWRLIEEDVPN